MVKPIYRQASEIIQAIHNELPTLGTIVSVGPGKRDKKGRLKPLDVKPGDKIKFGAGDYLKFPEYWEGNEKYLVLQEDDVAGILDAA